MTEPPATVTEGGRWTSLALALAQRRRQRRGTTAAVVVVLTWAFCASNLRTAERLPYNEAESKALLREYRTLWR